MSMTDEDVGDALYDVITGTRNKLRKKVEERVGNGNCWESVIGAASAIGLYGPKQCERIKKKTGKFSYKHLVDPTKDPRIGTEIQMNAVPSGHILGFFRGTNLFLSHVMMSLGNGLATGKNNNIECINFLHSWNGWIVFNIALEIEHPRDPSFGINPPSRWQGTHFLSSIGEQIFLYHSPVTQLSKVEKRGLF